MNWRIITITLSMLLLLNLLYGCGSSDKGANDDTTSTTLMQLGQRSYLLALPAAYQQGRSYKLLLAFHPSGGSAKNMQSLTRLEQYSDDYIVAYPSSEQVEWNEGCDCNIARDIDDLGFVENVIADVSARYQITEGEIYAAGFSQGGLFAQNLVCNRGAVFKAVAVVAASMSNQLAINCPAEQPVSVLMVHGTADPVLPYQGSDHSNFGLMSSPYTIRLLAKKHAGLPYPLLKSLPALGAELISYTNGQHKYQLFGVIDGGHRWRFNQLDTSAKIIEFFANLTKPEMPEHSRIVTVAEQDFHVRAMGESNTGPAVVLLAGPNQNYHSDSAWFAALQPLLAQQYRVYSIDRLGNAYSSSADDVSYRRFADQLPAVLQLLGEQQLVLVAFSSASISARLFYQQHQQQFDIKAMLYIDPDIPLPHSLSLYQGYPADWYLANLEPLLPHLATGAWTERTWNKISAERALAEQLVANHTELMDWQYFEQISQQRLLIPNQQSRAREIAAYSADLNRYAQLPMISTIPVSVIDSDFERQAIAEAEPEQVAPLQQWMQEGSQWSQEQASLSNGQYIALADSDHLVPLQHPEQINQAIDWLFAQLQLP